MKFVPLVLKTSLGIFLLALLLYWNITAVSKLLININLKSQSIQVTDLEIDQFSLQNSNIKSIKAIYDDGQQFVYLQTNKLKLNYDFNNRRFNLRNISIEEINIKQVKSDFPKPPPTKSAEAFNLEKILPQVWFEAIVFDTLKINRFQIESPEHLKQSIELTNIKLNKTSEKLSLTLDPLSLSLSGKKNKSHPNNSGIEVLFTGSIEKNGILFAQIALNEKSFKPMLTLSGYSEAIDTETLKSRLDLNVSSAEMLPLVRHFTLYSDHIQSTDFSLSATSELFSASKIESNQSIMGNIHKLKAEITTNGGFQSNSLPFKRLSQELSLSVEYLQKDKISTITTNKAAKLSLNLNAEKAPSVPEESANKLLKLPITLEIPEQTKILITENSLSVSKPLSIYWGKDQKAPQISTEISGIEMSKDTGGQVNLKQTIALKPELNRSLKADLNADINLNINEDQISYHLKAEDKHFNLNFLVQGKTEIENQVSQISYNVDLDNIAKRSNNLSRIIKYINEDIDLTQGALTIDGDLKADLSRGKTKLNYRFDLNVRDLGFIYDTYQIKKLNFKTEIDGENKTLKSKEAIPMHINEVLAGVSISKLSFNLDNDFHLDSRSTLNITGLEGGLLGGKIKTKDFDLTISHPLKENEKIKFFTDIDAEIDDIELKKVLELQESKEISGDGKLYGQLPITLNEENFIITDGWVHGKPSGGTIKYTPDQASRETLAQNPQMKLMLDVLGHLRYKKLEMDVNLKPSGQMTLTGHLEGSNPDYKDGYPVVFNPSLELNFFDMLTSIQIGQDISENITKRIHKKYDGR